MTCSGHAHRDSLSSARKHRLPHDAKLLQSLHHTETRFQENGDDSRGEVKAVKMKIKRETDMTRLKCNGHYGCKKKRCLILSLVEGRVLEEVSFT